MAKILFLVAQEGFQTKEYGDARVALERAGHTVLVASTEKGIATSNVGEVIPVDIAIRDARASDYDGIFAIGGSGALRYLDNSETKELFRGAVMNQKFYGAICISPRILAGAGVLSGKRATGWNDDGKLKDIFDAHEVTLAREPVVVDGRVITANGPMSAEAFGYAIARAFLGET